MSWQTKNAAPPSSFDMNALFRGLLVSLGATVVLILALAALIQYTSLKESSLPTAGFLVLALSNLIGGFSAGRRAGNRGLWHGLGVGLAFAITALLISVSFFSDSITLAGSLTKGLISAVCGIIGGILGVGYER